ncbi:CGNR zinc finger domain-containing protein [Spirillospora sp. NPDC048911]|uniref:CGNR zinc finger domain-containing protein n=1 Tax=Spirillospora sp. NPDC048911 TaxID=3364527 RepID=UPI0037168435
MAPGPLALVQAFTNSANVEFGRDEFATTRGLEAWLERHGFAAPGLVPDELDRREAVTLREAFRAILRENNGGPIDEDARRTVEHIARDCPLVVGFDAPDGRLALRPVLSDMRGVLATVLETAATAVSDGSWQRLKACSDHRCEWIFYDRSRNRSSRWCSMAVCGTRSKMTTYRQGKRQHG